MEFHGSFAHWHELMTNLLALNGCSGHFGTASMESPWIKLQKSATAACFQLSDSQLINFPDVCP